MMPTLSPAMGAHGEKIQWEGVPLRCVEDGYGGYGMLWLSLCVFCVSSIKSLPSKLSAALANHLRGLQATKR